MSAVSYIPKTSLEATIVVDGKYLGLLSIESRRRTPDKLGALIQKACEKHSSIVDIAGHLMAAGWDVTILQDSRCRKLFVCNTSRALDTRSVTWSVEDVLAAAKAMKVKLSRKAAREVLHMVFKKHDASQGINWDVISVWINELRD